MSLYEPQILNNYTFFWPVGSTVRINLGVHNLLQTAINTSRNPFGNFVYKIWKIRTDGRTDRVRILSFILRPTYFLPWFH